MQLLQKRLLLILQIATVCVFLGRAWQHLYWDAPFRTLLWDEGWMKGIVEGWFNMAWQDYVRSAAVDQGIQTAIRITGIFYILCALAAIFINQLKRWAYPLLYLGAFALFFLAFLECKERFFFLAQFLEYALQFSAPVFLIIYHRRGEATPQLIFWMKVMAALTFVSHGLFAIGYYPRPGYFVEMVMNIMGIGQEAAVQVLNIAGILDFVVSVLIFFPKRWAVPALAYMVFWGFGTTIARVWGYFHPEIIMDILNQWFYQSVFRAPHFLIPFAVLLYYWKRN